MSDTLENYIRKHRNELDVFTPSPEVWSGIETGIPHPTFIKSTVSWLKYAGFSASLIAVIIYLKINYSADKNTPARVSEPKAHTSVQIISPANVSTVVKENQTSVVQPTEKKKNSEKSIASSPVTVKETLALSRAPLGEGRNEVTTAFAPAPPKKQVSSGMWTTSKDSLRIDTAFSGVKTIEVHCSSFDVNVSTISGDKISFTAKSHTEVHGLVFGKMRRIIVYERKEDVLKIIEKNEGKNTFVVGTINVKKSSVMNFEVPVSTNLVIHSSYGDVNAIGLQGKICDINSKSGDVKLDNISTELKLNMGYGDLSATNITGNVSGNISSGDASFSYLKGDVDIETSYGEQHYKDVTGNIKARCSSGDLKINRMKGDVYIDSKYGDIMLEDFKGNPVLHTSSGDIKGKKVELTEKMEATTNYGDIKMEIVNELSALSFDLETNYGTITIDKEGQKIEEGKKLVLKKGSVLIKAHTSSGDQSYK